jgi:transposase
VLAVYEEPAELSVVVETLAAEIMFCRGCGGRAEAHDRMSVPLRDLPCFARPVRLVWRKRRWRCPEPWCGSRTWTEECEAARPRLLMTTRAGRELARPVSSVARENGLAWGTVMSAVRYYGQPLVDASDRVRRVRAAGLDETKFLSADGRRATQYVTSVVDLDRCKVIDLVEGNSADDISRWCRGRPRGFLRAITVVATDLTESYRAGITPYLDHALRVADPFHVVRVRREAPCFRGRVRDPPLRAVAAVR